MRRLPSSNHDQPGSTRRSRSGGVSDDQWYRNTDEVRTEGHPVRRAAERFRGSGGKAGILDPSLDSSVVLGTSLNPVGPGVEVRR